MKNSYEDPIYPPTIVSATSILIVYRASLGLEYWQKRLQHTNCRRFLLEPLFWFTKRHIISRSNKHFQGGKFASDSELRDNDTKLGFWVIILEKPHSLHPHLKSVWNLLRTQLYGPRASIISLNCILKQIVLKSIWQRAFLRCWEEKQIVLYA